MNVLRSWHLADECVSGVEGDCRPAEWDEAPGADQAVEQDAGDDAACCVSEGGEAQGEAGLDGASATGQQR